MQGNFVKTLLRAIHSGILFLARDIVLQLTYMRGTMINGVHPNSRVFKITEHWVYIAIMMVFLSIVNIMLISKTGHDFLTTIPAAIATATQPALHFTLSIALFLFILFTFYVGARVNDFHKDQNDHDCE